MEGLGLKLTFQTRNLPHCALLALLWGHQGCQDLLSCCEIASGLCSSALRAGPASERCCSCPKASVKWADTSFHWSSQTKSFHLSSRGLGEQIVADTIFSSIMECNIKLNTGTWRKTKQKNPRKWSLASNDFCKTLLKLGFIEKKCIYHICQHWKTMVKLKLYFKPWQRSSSDMKFINSLSYSTV